MLNIAMFLIIEIVNDQIRIFSHQVQELSADYDPEGESIEYLAMWKAREKPPSWTIPFNQDDIKTSVNIHVLDLISVFILIDP